MLFFTPLRFAIVLHPRARLAQQVQMLQEDDPEIIYISYLRQLNKLPTVQMTNDLYMPLHIVGDRTNTSEICCNQRIEALKHTYICLEARASECISRERLYVPEIEALL